MKKTLTLMLLLGVLASNSSFSADQNISWSQDDLMNELPVVWGTSDDFIITATTDLNFSGQAISENGNPSLIYNGDPSAIGSLTFTSTGKKNYTFGNISPQAGSSTSRIIHGCNVSFTQIGNLVFAGKDENLQGIDSRNTSVSFSNTGDISFSNFTYNFSGAAIYSWSEDNTNGVQFSNTGNISFISNSAATWGGAIASNNIEFDQIKGNILFHDNHANGDAGGAISAFGGAEGEISFSNVTGSVVFTKNTAGVYQGGAIGTNKNVTFDHIQGGILFADNQAVSDGGAITNYNRNNPSTMSFTNIGKGIEFSNNESRANGGSLAGNHFIFSDVTGNILFSGNRTESIGGAIYVANGLTIDKINGDVVFLNNHAGYDAGAIFLGTDSESTIKATGGNILFSGNTCEDNGIYVPNAISMDSGSTLTLIAETGRTITFHDPITGGAATRINLNGDETRSTNGTIVFSGKSANPTDFPIGENESQEDYQARLRHARCYFAQYISQYGGAVILEDSAVLEVDMLYIANDSLLKLGENTSAVASFFTRGDTARISISKGASITLYVGDLDLTQGLDVNLASFLSGESSATTFTLLNGGQLNLGGMLNFVDQSGTLYLSSSALSRDTSFALLTDANASRGETDFEGIANPPAQAYGYQGVWNLAWQNDTLFVNWKVSGYKASPEQIGTSGINSLWSSASNLQSFADASLDQTTRYRLISPQKSNYWISGLGDFSTQRTVRGINGYDYHGGGYAVGGDHKIADDTLLGLGFGQIFGKNQSRSYYSGIDQKSIMGMIYAAKRVELNKTNALRFNLSAAYGTTDNKMTTHYSQGGTSHANWDNQAYGLNARVMWDINLKDNWTLSPFIGLEYIRVNEDDFTESGDMARTIKGGHLGNLSLPVGISLEKLTTLGNGMKWENTATLAYRGDLYRKNPESNVALVSDPGFARWASKGSKPARNSVEASILSRLHINDRWNVYAGYSMEGRSNGIDQTGSLGVGLTF